MPNSEQPEGRDNGTRPPSLAARGERRRIERRLQEAGILCQPEVSLQYQTLAKRSVLRGVESGGAIKEIGRYVTFCDERGERIRLAAADRLGRSEWPSRGGDCARAGERGSFPRAKHL